MIAPCQVKGYRSILLNTENTIAWYYWILMSHGGVQYSIYFISCNPVSSNQITKIYIAITWDLITDFSLCQKKKARSTYLSAKIKSVNYNLYVLLTVEAFITFRSLWTLWSRTQNHTLEGGSFGSLWNKPNFISNIASTDVSNPNQLNQWHILWKR